MLTEEEIENYLIIVSEMYSEDEILEMVDNRISEYVDFDWEEEYESEYDWYCEYGNGEAELDIVEMIVYHLQKKIQKTFDTDDFSEMCYVIAERYALNMGI